MGTESLWHWIIVAAVVLLLFGRGKVSELMEDAARGINMAEEDLAISDPEREMQIAIRDRAAQSSAEHQSPNGLMLSDAESAICSLEIIPTICDGGQAPAVRDTTAIVASCRVIR
jgi:sec-independent protein translocase protein TatA